MKIGKMSNIFIILWSIILVLLNINLFKPFMSAEIKPATNIIFICLVTHILVTEFENKYLYNLAREQRYIIT